MFMIYARKHITTVKIRMNPLTWQLGQLLVYGESVFQMPISQRKSKLMLACH